MARPTKYSPAVQEAILASLRGGNTRTASAKAAGINYDTLLSWLKRYPKFLGDVEKVEAEAEAERVGYILASAKGGIVLSRKVTTRKDGSVVEEETYARPEWTAAAWWLERRRHQDWGRREARQDEGEDSPDLALDL